MSNTHLPFKYRLRVKILHTIIYYIFFLPCNFRTENSAISLFVTSDSNVRSILSFQCQLLYYFKIASISSQGLRSIRIIRQTEVQSIINELRTTKALSLDSMYSSRTIRVSRDIISPQF